MVGKAPLTMKEMWCEVAAMLHEQTMEYSRGVAHREYVMVLSLLELLQVTRVFLSSSITASQDVWHYGALRDAQLHQKTAG
jgi:hypothetical protein